MRLPGITLLIFVSVPIFVFADELDLAEGARLNGVIKAISPEGIITADLEIAGEPVDLHADKVKRVRFAQSHRKFDHDTMLTLVNGDRLPCDLKAISETDITVTTGYAGSLTVPRKVVSTVQLGMRPRKTIYAGPKNLKHWTVDDNWHFQEDSLISDGRGSISREFEDIPESYSLSFRLKWSDKPMFKVYFASDGNTVSGGKHDRYYLQVGTAGIEIKRQSSGRTNYHSMITVDRSNESFENQQAHFEVRFDHRQRRMMLYIDGLLEGQAADPLTSIPKGKTVILQSDDANAEAHRVSEIVIREWDAAGERHRSEDRGEFGDDALINNKGERWGGRLLRSIKSSNSIILLFKSPLSPDALNIPVEEVSTLFFKESENDQSTLTPLVLGLSGSGSIGALACTFDSDEVHLTNPLLGQLTLSRDAVKLLQRRDLTEDEEGESNSEE
jgi:hypothetical protein